MYTPNEWTVIRQGLDLVTITGKNAKDLAALQVKVEKDIQKSNCFWILFYVLLKIHFQM